MKVFLSAWLLLVGGFALAQAPPTPKKATPATVKVSNLVRITLIDQTVIQGRIIRRDSQKIYYTKPGDPSKRTYQQLLSRLDRIRYADGHEETFQKPTVSTLAADPGSPPKPVSPTPAPAETPVVASSPTPPVSSDTYLAKPTPVVPKNSPVFGRIHLTIGPELAYFPASINKQWSDVAVGIGINQNIGGSLRFDYRFMRSAALSLSAGYSNWQLVRNYVKNGVEQYDETIQQTRIPLQVGLKVYVGTRFYVMPQAGVNLLSISVKTSASHPAPDNQKSNATPVSYGAGIGYEIQAGRLLIDLSGHYQLMNVRNLNFGTVAPVLSEQVQFASVRLGIGLNELFK